MSCVFSPKTTINLMQNNDLPPPTKLFSGREGLFLSSISKIYDDDDHHHHHHIKKYGDDDKLEILKALHLSQTRATEAERKLRIVSEEKEAVSRMLVDESMTLLAHRQWLNLLEFEVLKLEREREEEEAREISVSNRDHSEQWCGAAIAAVCLAIAGVGFAFGCRYLF